MSFTTAKKFVVYGRFEVGAVYQEHVTLNLPSRLQGILGAWDGKQMRPHLEVIQHPVRIQVRVKPSRRQVELAERLT